MPRCTIPSALLRPWALASLALACAPGASDAPGTPRNAILISIDTLRPDHLGCYGYARPTSPHLDALAGRGALFSDVTSAAPWTLPSHASMLTGLLPSHHGVKSHSTRLSTSIATVAEDLQSAGYRTLAVVNTHNVGAGQFQLAQGFESFEYVPETAEDPSTLRLRTLNMGRTVVAHAEQGLAAGDRSRPFFLFLHFYDVHTDFTPDEEYRRELVRPYGGKLDGRTQQLNGARNRGETLDEDDLRFLRDMYDAEIKTLDGVLGEFFAWLEDQGLARDTLVLVTSDHGEEFQEHGGLLHGRTQYQELLRVPLIAAGPGVPSGTVIARAVHGVDVTPTLLGALGVPSSQVRDGIDLSVAWKGGELPERVLFGEADQDNSRLGAEQFDTKAMVRRGSMKLILDRRRRRTELYDLASDPHELHDLEVDGSDVARELGQELQRLVAGARIPEAIAAPTPDEQRRLDAMGYGGTRDE